MRLISQLINGFSRVLKNLLHYFNSTIILRAFVPSSPVESIAFCLNLNEALLLAGCKLRLMPALVKGGSSL